MKSKTGKTLHTAITAILNTIVTGILSLYVTRLILINFGSDFNGLNATSNQLISILLIIEGGLTLATNVALFKPLSMNNVEKINGILSATKRNFLKIGLLVLIFGFLSSIIYSRIIISELPRTFILLVFLMTTISTSFNLIFSTKYSILLQSDQREYIINYTKIFQSLLSQLVIIIIVINSGSMLLVRFVIMVFAIFNSISLILVSKKLYPNISFSGKPDYDSIKGTRDVFIQKVTLMLYSSSPILFISAFAGTLYTSVYAIYSSILAIIKSIIYSIVNAPRMSLGHLLQEEKESQKTLNIFLSYETVVTISLAILLSVTGVLIIPFIRLYTQGITDVNYVDYNIAILLILTTFFEVIHIPSGNIINLSGRFKISKKIQSSNSILIILLMLIGYYLFGFYGIISSVLITAIIIALMEIIYVHIFFYKNSIMKYLKILVPIAITFIILIVVESIILRPFTTLTEFFLNGIVLVLINSAVIFLISLIFNYSITKALIHKYYSFFKK
jgi:hypothetical protein